MRIEPYKPKTPTTRLGTAMTQPLPPPPPPPPPPEPKIAKDEVKIENSSQTKSTSEVAKAAKEAQVAQIGNRIVDGARKLHSDGYVYPANLTSEYRHDPGKIGCCADFVCDSYKEAGFDINKDMSSKGYNPHYCPSMIRYFQENQTLLAPNAKAQVGDAVFFDWDGNGKSDPDHVAVVTKVDDQGRPVELMESRKFSQPTEITTLNWNPPDSRASKIVGIGRLKDATADNAAANLLPPLPAGDAPRGSTTPRSEGGSGGPARDYGPVSTQAGKPTNYVPPQTALMILQMILSAIGLSPEEAGDPEALAKFAAEIAKNPDANLQELAEKCGVKLPADKLEAFKAQVQAHAGAFLEAGKVAEAASADTAKWLGKMSEQDIEKVLQDRNSPLAGKGKFILQMEQRYGVPAAQFLAMGTMESGLGTNGYTQGEHHNIGNIRPGSSWEGPTVQGGSGAFRSYGTAEEGVEDYFKLLSGPLYRGKTLADQINTYAPPSENDTGNYINTVVKLIDQWTT